VEFELLIFLALSHYLSLRSESCVVMSLPAVVCGRAHVLFTLFVFVEIHIVVSNNSCVVFVLFFFVLCVAGFSGLSILYHLTLI